MILFINSGDIISNNQTGSNGDDMEEDVDHVLTDRRFNIFKEKLSTVLNNADDLGATGISYTDVFMQINNEMRGNDFSASETEEALKQMSALNQIFYSDGMVYRI